MLVNLRCHSNPGCPKHWTLPFAWPKPQEFVKEQGQKFCKCDSEVRRPLENLEEDFVSVFHMEGKLEVLKI